MSWTKLNARPLLLIIVGLMAAPVSARASSLTLEFGSTDTDTNTKPPFTNPGPAPTDTSFFTGSFNLASGSQITVAGSFDFNFRASTAILSDSATGHLDVPTQTQALSLQNGPLVINTTPSGSAQLTLANPVPSVLTNAQITNLTTTLVGPGQSPTATSNPITVNGNGTLNINILNLTSLPIDVDASLSGNATASIDHIGYTQTSGNMLLGPGALGPNAPADQTATYPMSISPIGVLDGAANLGLHGNVDISILGIDVGGPSLNFNQLLPLSTSFPLPGTAKLADLNPTGYDPVHHDDLQATLGLNNGMGGGVLNVDLPVNSTGTALLVTSVTSDGGLYSLTAEVTGTITYGILGTLQASNVGYQLQDSIANVVVPEPGSVALLFVGLVAASPFVIARMRRR